MAFPPKPEKKAVKTEEPPLYLTETHESIENLEKAYGGYIKEGQGDDEYLEQLRRKKIMELEKKRQQRTE